MRWLNSRWIVSLIGLYAQSSWGGPIPLAEILQIHSENRTFCTASLFRIGKSCVFASNAHCAEGGVSQQIFADLGPLSKTPLEESPFPILTRDAEGVESTPLEIIARKPEWDLVLFAVPSAIQDDCAKLKKIESDFGVSIAKLRTEGAWTSSFASVGFVMGAMHANYSADYPWDRQSPPSSRTDRYRSGPDPNDYFIEVKQLNTTPGMSGGLVFAWPTTLVGLNSRFIPFQSISFIIPLEKVILLANSVGNLAEDKPPIFNFGTKGISAAYFAPRSNDTYPAGDNGHANGGDNGHANGGSGPVDRRFQGSPLLLFREPDEGVPLSRDSNQILLAIDREQIDGSDDYWIKYFPRINDPAATLILREKGGYPDSKVRDAMIKRLDGVYESADRFSDYDQDQNDVFYMEDASVREGFKVAAEGFDHPQIDVDSQAHLIHFIFPAHYLHAPNTQSHMTQIPGLVYTFKLKLSNDSKTITLDGSGRHLTCENNNFLKLICSGDGIEIALSADRLSRKKITYRMATLMEAGGKRVINYHYGVVSESGDQATSRKTISDILKEVKKARSTK